MPGGKEGAPVLRVPIKEAGRPPPTRGRAALKRPEPREHKAGVIGRGCFSEEVTLEWALKGEQDIPTNETSAANQEVTVCASQ